MVTAGLGGFYVLIGILGFIPGFMQATATPGQGLLLGIFAVIIHLALGAVLLWGGLSSATNATMVNKVMAIVSALLVLASLIVPVAEMGVLVALIRSALDHARVGFDNPWLWVPLAAGVFGMVVAAILGMIQQPTRADLLTYLAAMIILLGVGGLGALLQVQADLALNNAILAERFLSGAPFMALMLVANMGLIGLIVLLDPAERRT
jgi:hypothetical protein